MRLYILRQSAVSDFFKLDTNWICVKLVRSHNVFVHGRNRAAFPGRFLFQALVSLYASTFAVTLETKLLRERYYDHRLPR